MSLPLPLEAEDPRDTALVRTLGHAGLIPFALLAVLVWLVNAELQAWVAMALVAYAALIVSFLGGIHWGIGWLASERDRQARRIPRALHAQRRHFLWGIVPSLLAWPGVLMPPFAGLAWLGAARGYRRDALFSPAGRVRPIPRSEGSPRP